MIVPVRLKTLIIDTIIIYWWDFMNGTLFQLPRDHVVQSKEMITLDNSTLNRPPDYQISFFIRLWFPGRNRKYLTSESRRTQTIWKPFNLIVRIWQFFVWLHWVQIAKIILNFKFLIPTEKWKRKYHPVIGHRGRSRRTGMSCEMLVVHELV